MTHLQDADIAAFSVCVWNFRISLAIARELKQRNPHVLIVFGGSQVPNRPEGFLRSHPYVDIACHGEGERVFLQILENHYSRNWNGVRSISYLDKGIFVQNERMARIGDLSKIPSPYLTGLLDGLMENHGEHAWVALWETNRGCPFSCAYCDWGSAEHTRLTTFDMHRCRQEIEWFANKKIEFVFCCDANFGLLPRDLDIVRLVVDAKNDHGYPQALSVQNTKNATERSFFLQTMLSEAGLNKGVNLALQTVDEATLTNIGRSNISLTSFYELQHRFSCEGIDTFTDLILGLPGESYDSFADGVNQIIENGQHNRIQFINLAILPNARMGDPQYQKEHGLVAAETKIINIHGLRADDDVTETQQLVVATNTMPREDWVRARVFSWMTSLLYFDKTLQIPFILLHGIRAYTYRELVESFLLELPDRYPIITEINSFFVQEAESIQNGGPEYCYSREWLNIFWPADEYVLIKLVVEDILDGFYAEAERRILQMLEHSRIDVPPFLHESIELNRDLLKRPFQTQDLILDMKWMIHEYYKSVLTGQVAELRNGPVRYRIDRTTQVWSSWDDWFREVIWYGNKTAAYLYPVRHGGGIGPDAP